MSFFVKCKNKLESTRLHAPTACSQLKLNRKFVHGPHAFVTLLVYTELSGPVFVNIQGLREGERS